MQRIYLEGYTARADTPLLYLGTCGSYGVEQLRILPGDGWENLSITAVFSTDGTLLADPVPIPESGIIDVPPGATARTLSAETPGRLVFRGVADGMQRITANLLYIVTAHAPADGEAPPPSPDMWEQIDTRITQRLASAVPPDGPAGTVLTKTEAGNAWQEAPGQSYTIGSGLKLDEASRTLSVDTADGVEQDNTRPITSAAVFTTVGNIEVLLSTI